MTLSVRMAPLTAAIVTVVFYGAAWIDGIAHLIANALGNEGVAQGTLAAGLLFPSDGLWRGALYGLEPVAMRAAGVNGAGGAGPFAVLGPPTDGVSSRGAPCGWYWSPGPAAPDPGSVDMIAA
jgi:hypothetical protein